MRTREEIISEMVQVMERLNQVNLDMSRSKCKRVF